LIDQSWKEKKGVGGETGRNYCDSLLPSVNEKRGRAPFGGGGKKKGAAPQMCGGERGGGVAKKAGGLA